MTKPNPAPPCKTCGIAFTKAHMRQIYCCIACAVNPRIRKGAADECWPWTGATNNHGYGQLRINCAPHYAHRLAYEMHTGTKLVRSQFICHSCDNPPCCNPAHMTVGTQLDNIGDMARKERSGTAKLTAPQVRTIRSLRGTITRKQMAAAFGVSTATIDGVLSGRYWSHVT